MNGEELLQARLPPKGLAASVLGRVPSGEIQMEAIEVQSGIGVWTPSWLFLPKESDKQKPALVLLEPQGRNSRWLEGALYPSLAEAGCVVCAADLRGVGDLTAEFGRGAPRYTRPHQEEEHYAWASLMLGKPLLGQRVTDLLALVEALSSHGAFAGRRLIVGATGKMTLPALFAAALDSRVAGLYLAGGLVSYRSIVESEEYTHPFANFVPRILLHTDLPEIASSMQPRPVTLAGAVDAAGKQLNVEAVRKTYGGSSNIRVSSEPDWNVETLSVIEP